MFEAVKRETGGRVLPLEAGNALFADPRSTDDAARARARLIVQAIAGMGVKAMGVGVRDLAAGPGFLKKLAAKHGVQPLSANLVNGGKRLFAPSAVLEVQGLKVGVIGASPVAGYSAAGLAGQPLVEAVIPEARRLRPTVDLVVVLAAVPYADALALAEAAGGWVDLLLQSHDGRGMGPGVPVALSDKFLIHTGERGRQIARIDLDLEGSGPLADASAAERAKKSLELLDRQLIEVQKRIDSAKDESTRRSYAATLESFRKRRDQVQQTVAAAPSAGRHLRLSYPALGPDVASDPALAQQVARLPSPNGH